MFYEKYYLHWIYYQLKFILFYLNIFGQIISYNNYYLEKNTDGSILANLRQQIKCLVILDHLSNSNFNYVNQFLTIYNYLILLDSKNSY